MNSKELERLDKFFEDHPTKEALREFNITLNSILEAPHTSAEENNTVREIQQRVIDTLDLIDK